MKRRLRKSLSLILSVIMVLSTVVVAMPFLAATAYAAVGTINATLVGKLNEAITGSTTGTTIKDSLKGIAWPTTPSTNTAWGNKGGTYAAPGVDQTVTITATSAQQAADLLAVMEAYRAVVLDYCAIATSDVTTAPSTYTSRWGKIGTTHTDILGALTVKVASNADASTALIGLLGDGSYQGWLGGLVHSENYNATFNIAATSKQEKVATFARVSARLVAPNGLMGQAALLRAATIEAIPATAFANAQMDWRLNAGWLSTSTSGNNINGNNYAWYMRAVLQSEDGTTDLTPLKTALTTYRANSMYQVGATWTKYDLAKLWTLSAAELSTLQGSVQTAINAITAAGVTAANNDSVKAHFGVPTTAEITQLNANIVRVLAALDAKPNAEYFDKSGSGVLVTAPYSVFTNSLVTAADKAAFAVAINDIVDNPASYPALDLNSDGSIDKTDLMALYQAAYPYYAALLGLWTANNASQVLSDIKAQYDSALDTNFAENTTHVNPIKTWLNNLNYAYSLLVFSEVEDEITDFINAHTLADIHKGAETDTDGNSRWSDDPSLQDGDLPYSTDRVLTLLLKAEEYKVILDAFGTIGQTYKDQAFVDSVAAAFPNAAAFYALYATLNTEKSYRNNYEPEWYVYRNYYNALVARTPAEWAAISKTSAKDVFTEAKTKSAGYDVASAACKTAIGETLWKEIYFLSNGTVDYKTKVKAAIDAAGTAYAGFLAAEVNSAMNIYDDYNVQNLIAVPGTGNDLKVSLDNIDALAAIIRAIEQSIYSDLASSGSTAADRLAYLNAYDVHPIADGTAIYAGARSVAADYTYLITRVLLAVQEFEKDPEKYWPQTQLDTPIGSGDYVTRLGDSATDLGRTDGEDYEVTEDTLTTIIGSLSHLLADGVLPSLDNLGVSVDALTSLGVDTGKPLTIGNILDDIFNSVVYTDAIVNTIIQTIYPAVLDAFEDVWAENLGAIHDTQMDGGSDANDVWIYCYALYEAMAFPNNKDIVKNTSAAAGMFADLALYPDLLAKNISSTFPQAKSKLAAASIWVGATDEAKRINASQYPNGAWTPAKFPALFDENGSLDLYWGIDDAAPANKAALFKQAMSEGLSGAYQLLAALLLGQDKTLYQYRVAQFQNKDGQQPGGTGAPTNVPAVGTHNAPTAQACSSVKLTAEIWMKIDFSANDGYAKVLTPIFEALFGMDAAAINGASHVVPTVAELKAVTTSTQLVNKIFDPLDAYLTKLKSAPASEILKLLPNLAYALNFNKILPLLNNLEIALAYEADGEIWTKSNPCGDGMNSKISGSNPLKGSIPPLNIADMLLNSGDSSLDLSFLESIDGLVDMVLGDTAIPQYNAKRLATYGVMRSSVDGKTPALPTNRPTAQTGPRLYLDTDQADTLFAALKYILNPAAFEALGISGLGNFDSDQAIAALAELFVPYNQPVGYAMKTVGYDTSVVAPKYSFADTSDFTNANAAAVIDYALQILNGGALKNSAGQTVGLTELLNGLLGDNVFNNTTFSLIKNLLYDNLINNAAIAEYLPLIAEILPELDIAQYTAWQFDDENAANYFWTGVGNGDDIIADQAEFQTAIGKFLSPVATLLKNLLLDIDTTVLDTIVLPGYDGYSYGFIPLMEGLTFTDGLLSKAEILNLNGADFINGLLAPIFNGLSTIVADPVNEVLVRLPQLLFFITSSTALSDTVTNLLKAPLVWIDTIKPIYPLVDEILPYLSYLTPQGILNEVSGIVNDSLDLSGFGIDLSSILTLGNIQSFIAGDLKQYNSLTNLPTIIGAQASGKYPRIEATPVSSFCNLVKSIVQLIISNPSIIGGPLGDPFDAILATVEREPHLVMQVLYNFFYAQPLPQGPITYDPADSFPNLGTGSIGHDEWWTQDHIDYAYDNIDDFVNKIWTILFGKPLGSVTGTIDENLENGNAQLDTFLTDLLGQALYTQENFELLVNLVKDIVPDLSAIEIGGVSLGEFLKTLVFLDGAKGTESLDLDAILAPFVNYKPGDVTITDRNSFVNAIIALIEPAMPVVNVLLAGNDIKLVELEDTRVPETKYVVTVYGADGYKYAITPILEALVLGLGEDKLAGIVDPDTFATLDDAAQIHAILDPILNTLDEVLANPTHNLLKVLPSILYFVDSSNLNQCIEKLLAPVNAVIKAVNPIYPIEPIVVSVDLASIVSDLIASTGLTISYSALTDLVIGNKKAYTALSGASDAFYIEVTEPDAANMLTAILRFVVDFAGASAFNVNAILDYLVANGLKDPLYTIVKQTLNDISKFIELGYHDSAITGNRAYFADIVLNAAFTLCYGVDAVATPVYKAWQSVNKQIRDLYEHMLGLQGYQAAFAKNVSAFQNRYFSSILTPEKGLAPAGFVQFFLTLVAWIKKIFGFFF
ncbi:MAG: hypothetical protein LBT21_05800 [Oscillospiraceae bacterium]|jgi:hypothetical protein|nr:hypothetical protein [Oscillospiraceae bacterium]